MEGNVVVDLKEAELEGGNLTHSSQGTVQYQDQTNLFCLKRQQVDSLLKQLLVSMKQADFFKYKR